MAGTRSSARQAAKSDGATSSSPPSTTKTTTGTKRKATDTSPTSKAKRGKQVDAKKEQKTLEQTIPAMNGEDDKGSEDVEMKETETAAEPKDAGGEADADAGAATNDEKANGGDEKDESADSRPDEPAQNTNDETKTEEKKNADEANALGQVKADEGDAGTTSKQEEEPTTATNGESANIDDPAVEEDKKREEVLPNNVLEKGLIYFFTRGRVGVENPESVQDLQRTFFVLRPLPAGGKITEGAIQDVGNNRLIALPKKVFPKSGKDRFMVFVEKAKASMETLKEEFFAGSDYSTKTSGTRHTPDVTPIGEGVYAMTSTGGGQGTSHLAYQLTIPQEIGEVQTDVGLKAKGSFVMSLKNPESGGPANAQLAEKPDYPKDFIEEFSGRSWMPPRPEHLVYANAQMLLIGEDFEKSNNLEPTAKDEKNDSKETPAEELEKLEGEDEIRVEHLKGDDTVFADLGISSKEYPKVMTTW